MIFQIPVQDQRYADSGKRIVKIGNRDVSAALSGLREEDQVLFGATHQIFIPKVPGVNPGMVIDFEGVPYRVVKIADPRANDPDMRGRYYRLICNPA
jgi:hypothetical protein